MPRKEKHNQEKTKDRGGGGISSTLHASLFHSFMNYQAINDELPRSNDGTPELLPSGIIVSNFCGSWRACDLLLPFLLADLKNKDLLLLLLSVSALDDE